MLTLSNQAERLRRNQEVGLCRGWALSSLQRLQSDSLRVRSSPNTPSSSAFAVKLMGYSQLIRGHVGGVARGINIPNAQQDQASLASVNPIFTWVRLAQRVPVRIHIDQIPDGVRLVAGMTATVQIDPHSRASSQ
jgi:hypothetical protein